MSDDRWSRRRFRSSPLVKMILMGVLILALLIPLAMVGSLVAERQERRDEAVREVAATWGGEQSLLGPLLTVPYRVYGTDSQGKPTVSRALAHFLPETLNVQGRVAPVVRRRGIFEVILYDAELRVAGSFARPDLAAWRIAPQQIDWEDAYLTVAVADMRGLRHDVRLRFAGRDLAMVPGGGEEGLRSPGLKVGLGGLGSQLRIDPEGTSYAFAFDLGVDGSERLTFLPAGKLTTVGLASSWPHPSFSGGYLPSEDEVKGTGFTARWSVPWSGRSFPQQWRADDEEAAPTRAQLLAASFGVSLETPVDAYKKTERARKYGVLFLLLTFVTFFLYEVFSPISLHPVQYLLVGSALCLFYLLLLSISEHLPFATAYAIASAATVVLIAGYSWAVLRGKLRALLMGGILGTLYGYLYVLLQAEDYALLLGSIGLFLILALVMYLTRRIDWGGSREIPAGGGGGVGAAG